MTVEYGFWSQMAGRPRGMQLTDDFDSSSSTGVIALIFASAHGWNAGFSSGVARGSNCRRSAGSTPSRPLTPCPALLGSQWPERSTWPSGNRGGGPPGGITLIAYSVVLFWAAAAPPRCPCTTTTDAHRSATAAPQSTPG